MAVVEISYPLTVEGGVIDNIIPSNQRADFVLERRDVGITSITSGVDGSVRLEASAAFVELGSFVTFFTDTYGVRTGRILQQVNSTTIDVDVPFFSTNVSNGWINYLPDYYLEIRYVLENSTSNDQSAVEIINDYSRFPSGSDGRIVADITEPADTLQASFNISTYEAENLSIAYKIQYRESYRGNRSGAWISPSQDTPLLVVMGSKGKQSGFVDDGITKRFYRGYPLVHSIVYSDINDSGGNNVKILMNELTISKTFIRQVEVTDFTTLNGIAIFVIDTTQLDDDAVFLTFETLISRVSDQYEPTEYNPAEYA